MDLQTVCGFAALKKDIEFTDADIVCFDNANDLIFLDKPQSGAYAALLCLGGKGSCVIDNKPIEMHRGDCIFNYPTQFIENAMASFDFECIGFVMSPAFFESIFQLDCMFWDVKLIMLKTPVIHLDEEEISLFRSDYAFLKKKLENRKMPHYKAMINLLLQTLIYEFCDCIVPKFADVHHNFTSSESLFRRFIDLATAQTPRQREVNHYANQLCVTPKYLSVVCKQMSGSTAGEILNSMTVEHIKRSLRTTDKSIKEISTSLGFDNLSFFGKYVRRHLGMSPREYRQAKEAGF